jgi:hypothetical protein
VDRVCVFAIHSQCSGYTLMVRGEVNEPHAAKRFAHSAQITEARIGGTARALDLFPHSSRAQQDRTILHHSLRSYRTHPIDFAHSPIWQSASNCYHLLHPRFSFRRLHLAR